jgi:hypothetical protein
MPRPVMSRIAHRGSFWLLAVAVLTHVVMKQATVSEEAGTSGRAILTALIAGETVTEYQVSNRGG